MVGNYPKDLDKKSIPQWDNYKTFCSNIIIELSEKESSKVIATYFYKATPVYGWPDEPVVGITPKVVSEIIIESLANGWKPELKEDYQYTKKEKDTEPAGGLNS